MFHIRGKCGVEVETAVAAIDGVSGKQPVQAKVFKHKAQRARESADLKAALRLAVDTDQLPADNAYGGIGKFLSEKCGRVDDFGVGIQ